MRQRPIQAREIDAFRHYVERPVAASPAAAVEASRRVLSGGSSAWRRPAPSPRSRRRRAAPREVGSLLFHWAFILLLVGVVFGKGTGYTGYAVITEGDTWVDARANYDGQIRPGRFFSGDFTGIGLHLRSFESAYREHAASRWTSSRAWTCWTRRATWCASRTSA